MKFSFLLLIFCGVFSTSIKQLRKLRNTLEHNPVITAEKVKKKQRKLFMENEF